MRIFQLSKENPLRQVGKVYRIRVLYTHPGSFSHPSTIRMRFICDALLCVTAHLGPHPKLGHEIPFIYFSLCFSISISLSLYFLNKSSLLHCCLKFFSLRIDKEPEKLGQELGETFLFFLQREKHHGILRTTGVQKSSGRDWFSYHADPVSLKVSLTAASIKLVGL